MKKISRLMIKGAMLGLLVVLVAALPASGQGGSQGPVGFDSGHISQIAEGADVVPGEVVIKLANAATTAEVQALAGQVGGELAASIDILNAHLVVFPQADLATQALEALQANPAVVWAEPNYVGHVDDEGDISGVKFIPNDPKRPKQWQLASGIMNAYGAWDKTKGSSSKYIAILDTGADLNHPDLGGKLLKTKDWDFVHNDGSPDDGHNHGSHVAGIAAAYLNNGKGIAGLAGYNKVLPLQVCDASGSCTTWNTAQGIVYAVVQRARVINMSLGWKSPSHVQRAACDFAWRGNVVVVASSGNDGTYMVNYPAAFDSVISVASTNKSDNRSSFSTYHATVEVSAPGGTSGGTNNDIYSLNKSGGYMWMWGTSMSAPQVTGGFGLYFARNPTATAARARFCLHQAGVDDKGSSGWDQYYGWGRLDLRKLVICPARGKRVLIDNTHSNIKQSSSYLRYYWLRGFAEDLMARGYTVGWTSSTGMSKTALAKWDILVVFDPQKAYSSTERSNVRYWMRSTSRKKLIAMAEHGGYNDNAELNALLSTVGVPIRAAKATVYEPSYHDYYTFWPIVYNFARSKYYGGLLNSTVYETGMYAGTYLSLYKGSSWVAKTTSSATAGEVSGEEISTTGEPSSSGAVEVKQLKATGPFYIAAMANIGTKGGRAFVIGDTDIWSGLSPCRYGPCVLRSPNNLLWFENILGWW